MEETEESSYQMPVYKAKWYLPGGTMDRHCREHVQSILHSGLMFRSESLKVEKALLGYPLPSATMLGPYSPIETLGVVLSSGACVALLYKAKPILVGGAILLCFSAPLVLRLRPRPHLSRLLRALSAATRISWRSARLAQASLPQSLRLGIISLGEAFPWWGDAEDWEWEESVQDALSSKDPKRLYYLYLVLQSLFLYRVSVAHVPPAFPPRDLARRVTWLHETLVPRLCASVETALAAMKTADSTARKTLRNLAIPWGTLRSLPNSASNLERCLHAALEKCDGLFVTMKSKENNELLLKELHELKDYLFKSNVSIDEMISELMPKRVEFTPVSQANTEVEDVRIVSEETENVIEDQVFYCENQKDDVVEDMTTAIGVDCSMRLSSAVMGELKERLKEREEVMREREEKALIRTCPEIAACPPHFPRQLGDEAVEEKDKNIDLNETKDDSKECFEAGRLSDVKTINLDYEDVYDTSGSEAETGQGDTGLLKDARKFRISRKKRHPPSRSIVPTGTTELDADDRYNGGGGTAMAELLRARFVLSGSSEQEFIGEGEQSE